MYTSVVLMIGCMHHLIFRVYDSLIIELCRLVWSVFVNDNSLCAFHLPEYFVSVLYLCILDILICLL